MVLKAQDQIPLQISACRRTLLSNENPQRKSQDSLLSLPNRINFLKFGYASAKFRQLAQERDGFSRSVTSSSSHGLRERINGVFARRIDWTSLMKMGKEWIQNPMNMALSVWIMCVAISGAIFFLVMTGMLDHALPKKSQRDVWFEVNNQILNALSALMCLYQHPKRFCDLVLLCRWNPKDISRLIKIYCKNGTYKPHEWAHMMVVALLNLNCFAQYALCGLNLGYRRSERPAIGVGICISVAIAAPAADGVYSNLSPLGKDYESEIDEEAQMQISADSDLGTCVYVHILTFLHFCLAPFWIFNMAAVNIDNETVREALGITRIILCAFGLLYGGFWRIQMRKRFNLLAYTFCFGEPAVSDCTLWLCCCWCSLAQEVRAGNSYDIVEDKFCQKQMDCNGSNPSSPLGNNSSPSKFTISNSPSPSTDSKGYNTPSRQLLMVKEESSRGVKDETMTPPAP
ncbi:hypothetical protein Peur_006143 [Populus x canadensis]